MRVFPAISRDHIDLPASFPISISINEGVHPTSQRLHWHSVLEINYIKQGKGYYLINGDRFDFEQGDIIMIHSNDLHRAFEVENLVIGVIMFDPAYLALEQRYDTELLIPFRDIGIRFNHLLDRNHPELARLHQILVGMDEENTRKDPHYKSVVRAELIRFLAYVNRYFSTGVGTEEKRIRSMDTIRTVLHSMEKQIDYSWTLRELADMAHLSPSRFSALFVQIVGTSPMDYLIQLRLSRAVELLESSEQKIIDIAAECGFRNLSNFNRLFKQHIGKLPKELRA